MAWIRVALWLSVAPAITPAIALAATGSSSGSSSDSGTDTGSGTSTDTTTSSTDATATDGSTDSGSADSGTADSGGSNDNCSHVPPSATIVSPVDGATVPAQVTVTATYTPRCYCDELAGTGCWDEQPQGGAVLVDEAPDPDHEYFGPLESEFALALEPGEHDLTLVAYWGGDDGALPHTETDMIHVTVDGEPGDGGTSGGTTAGETHESSGGGCGCTASPRTSWSWCALWLLCAGRGLARSKRARVSQARRSRCP